MNKAVFLDRDGTINIEKNYLYKIEDFEFIDGVTEGLRLLQKVGYKLIIITNQSGIARGYYTEEDFNKLNTWMCNTLKNNGVVIDKVYYCPHHTRGIVPGYNVDCNCRKPKLGLYEQAISEFNIDLSKSYAIGDKLRDCEICKNSQCKGFLIGNNEEKEIIEGVKKAAFQNIGYEKDLYNAALNILKNKEAIL